MHHTKVKADIAVCQNGKVYKLQVKYASLQANGTINVSFRRSWVDNNGVHIRRYAKEEFDYYAIYCPEKETVLYVPNDPKCPKAIRFEKSANNQSRNVNWFKDYLQLNGSPQRLYAARLK